MKTQTYKGESLASALAALGCPCECVKTTKTPSLIRYDFNLTNIKHLHKIKKNLVLLSAILNEPIQQAESKKAHFCLEFIRRERSFCDFKQLHENLKDTKDGQFIFGVDENNECLSYNIADCPHLLVSGCTSSGKSVFINSIIASILCYSKNTGLILIDPKQVEFTQFENSRHLLHPIITDTDKAITVLNNLCDVMDERYKKLRNLGLQNNKNNTFHKIIVIVDELADLMLTSRQEVETPIVRLAQKGRACGIHLILATQRPTVNVVTGLIKANIPTRIAFAMSSVRDSVVMLDHKGAEQLLGKGDCLVKLPDRINTIRVQAPYICKQDIENILRHAPKTHRIAPTRLKRTKTDKEPTQRQNKAHRSIFGRISKTFNPPENPYTIDELNFYDCMED